MSSGRLYNAAGGWASDTTLKGIYRGVIDDYKEKFTNKVFEHLENMQHEISHKNKKALIYKAFLVGMTGLEPATP